MSWSGPSHLLWAENWSSKEHIKGGASLASFFPPIVSSSHLSTNINMMQFSSACNWSMLKRSSLKDGCVYPHPPAAVFHSHHVALLQLPPTPRLGFLKIPHSYIFPQLSFYSLNPLSFVKFRSSQMHPPQDCVLQPLTSILPSAHL